MARVNRAPIVALFLILAAIAALASPVTAEPAKTHYAVTNVEAWDVLYVRSRASTRGDIIAALPHDATGIAVTKSSGKNWLKIKYRNIEGWAETSKLSPIRSGGIAPWFPSHLSCSGQEPSWQISIANDNATYSPVAESKKQFKLGAPKAAVNRSNLWAMQATNQSKGGDALFLLQTNPNCSDGLSANKSSHEIFVNFNDGVMVTGCCKLP